MTLPNSSRLERIALIVLIAFAMLLMIGPLARLPFRTELANEGWNAIHAMHAFGRALYPEQPAWIVNNYPPLWFCLAGALGSFVGDPILAGRAIATLAFIVTACAIFVLLRRLAAGLMSSLIGALSFVVIVAGLLGNYVGLSEPQMLAHALVTSSTALLVGTNRKSMTILAAAGIVAGIFVKPIVIALPLAATFWLLIHRRHLVMPWIVAGATLSIAAFAACAIGYGPPFLANLAFPRVLTWERLGTNLALISKPVVPLIAFGWLARRRGWRDPALALVGYAIVASVVEILMFGGALGVSINIVFDLVIAASLGAGLAYDRLAVSANVTRWRVAFIIAIIARVAIGMPDPFKAIGAQGRAELHAQDIAVERVVAVIGPLEGPVACEALSACVWAGHASAADLWKLRFETTLDGPGKATLLDAVRSGRFSAIVTYANLASPADDRNLPGLYDALRTWYQPPIPAGQAFLIFLRKPLT